MMNKYLFTVAIVAALAAGLSAANAYPQSNFGTGYGFQHNPSNGAAAARAINTPAKQFVETADTEEEDNYTRRERKVSNVVRDHDEAPNAGYKTTYTYIEKDQSDYNPYTGADAGVNDTKSIYTDDLGRLHFFGKGSLFRSNK